MNDANNLWPNVSRLADSYSDAGLTPEERATHAMQEFDRMPHLAQRAVLVALFSLAPMKS